jgi:Xaa-Pro aminopeptidase
MTERQIKRQRVNEYLQHKGLRAVLLSNRDNFAWFTCGRDNHVVSASERGIATLLVTADRAWCLTTNIETPRLRDEELDADIEVVDAPWHEAEALADRGREIAGVGPIASDAGALGAPCLDADWAELRYSLTREEVGRYRALGADCSQIMGQLCKSLRPGDTEATVAARMHALACRRLVETYVCLIAADERILKYRHPIYTDRPIERCVMVVMCGRRHGLICSLTRMVHFGEPPEDLRRRHRAVCRIDAVLNLGARVGRPVGEIFDAAVRAYAEEGYPDEWRLHHQGGPTGYAGRDYFGRPGERRTVQPNQAFAWNPSITGTKSEDTILATQEGVEVLTAAEDWPMLAAAGEGRQLSRPDILVL